MAKRIYYNVPCTLFRNYLKDDNSRIRCLFDVINYAVYVEYMRLQDEIPEEAKRFDAACRNMGSGSLNMNEVLYDGERMLKSGKKEAIFSLDSEKYWEQVNEDKTPEERAMFLAWLALKSIQGNKPFAKTCNAMWLSRMDASTMIKKKGFGRKTTYSEPVERYNSKYKCSRLRALLYKYYHVCSDADGVRGFYFSTTLDFERFETSIKTAPKTDPLSEYKAAKAAAKASLKEFAKDLAHNLTRELAHDLTHDSTHNLTLK